MKEKSVFLEREGYTPKNKVLDFLIVAQDFDYSLKDIAKYSNVSYPCIKQLKKELIKDKWINLTRKVGKAQMYKLNVKNPVVEKFIDFYWAVIENEIKGKEKEGNKAEVKEDFKHSTSVGMAMSAKSV